MSARLTPQERADRALTEGEFEQQVIDYAAICGWTYVHFRAAQTRRGWRVPVQGPLGKGWPDWVFFRPGQTLYAELKREVGNDPSPDQFWVHEQIREAGNECYVWRPSDWPTIERILR